MTVCPQCGYERTKNDDNFISKEECPKCGIFYKKWQPLSISNNTEPDSKSSEALSISNEKKVISYKGIIAFAITFILLAIFAKFIFFTRHESPRLESTLPASPFPGTEGRSYIIYTSGNEETTTAAGQIFKPPLQTPVLLKLGFLFTQNSFIKRAPSCKLQVILSEWYGDRPGPTALWVSEPTTILSTDNNFQADWLDFDVPHLSLNPAKLYIAWVTLSGLTNQYDASIGISYSNESGANSHYPEGMCSFYKLANPYGNVLQMTNSSWEVHEVGHNLHFRMSFDNSKNAHDKKDLENNDSQNRLNETIQQKTNNAIMQWREKEQQKRGEIRQTQVEMEIQQQEYRKRQQEEREQQRLAQEEQRKQQQAEQEEQRKRQQIEREMQQYDTEKQREEMKQKQEEMLRDRLYSEPRRVQRIPRRR